MKRIVIFLIILLSFAAGSSAQTFEGINSLNSINIAQYLNDQLSTPPRSPRGDLLFSPSDVYLLARTIPEGISFRIKSYYEENEGYSLDEVPNFCELASTGADLAKIRELFKRHETAIIVYPAIEKLVIFVDAEPFAQVNAIPGIPEIKPTDAGNFKTFGATEHFGDIGQFGRQVLLWTANGRSYYPQTGYVPRQSISLEAILINDLAQILSQTDGEDIDGNLLKSGRFAYCKAANDFIESDGFLQLPLLSPLACSYYRLYNGWELSPRDLEVISPDVKKAFDDYNSDNLPWLPWEAGERRRIATLYYQVEQVSLKLARDADWYIKIKEDWDYWKGLRRKASDDFRKMGVYSRANRQAFIAKWLNDRLEFKEAKLPSEVEARERKSFSSFFDPDEEKSLFDEREKAAMRILLDAAQTGEAKELGFNSIEFLNNYNFGVLLNDMLGNLYRSHGCLHVSPRNILLLHHLLPIGAQISIYDDSKKVPEGSLEKIPYLADIVSFEADLKVLAAGFEPPHLVKIVVYLSSGDWLIYLDDRAYARLRVKGGPQKKRYVMQGREKNGTPIFEKSPAYPTSPGDFFVFKKPINYISWTYYDATLIPMGGAIKKEKDRWIFEDEKGKWRNVPDSIKKDLSLPAEKRNYAYYEKVNDAQGALIQAKWGSNPFGKYPILISADMKNPSPELIHTSGDLMLEQRQLVSDLIKVLSAPADKLEDCVSYSDNFDLYRACSDFIGDPQKADMIEPLYSGMYKLNYAIPMTTEEAALIPRDVLLADKILKNRGALTKEEQALLIKEGLARPINNKLEINTEKILGIQYDSFQYVVQIQKGANTYTVLRDHWSEMSKLREAFLGDFKLFAVKDLSVFHKFMRELMLKRIDMQELSQEEAYGILHGLLSNGTTIE